MKRHHQRHGRRTHTIFFLRLTLCVLAATPGASPADLAHGSDVAAETASSVRTGGAQTKADSYTDLQKKARLEEQPLTKFTTQSIRVGSEVWTRSKGEYKFHKVTPIKDIAVWREHLSDSLAEACKGRRFDVWMDLQDSTKAASVRAVVDSLQPTEEPGTYHAVLTKELCDQLVRQGVALHLWRGKVVRRQGLKNSVPKDASGSALKPTFGSASSSNLDVNVLFQESFEGTFPGGANGWQVGESNGQMPNDVWSTSFCYHYDGQYSAWCENHALFDCGDYWNSMKNWMVSNYFSTAGHSGLILNYFADHEIVPGDFMSVYYWYGDNAYFVENVTDTSDGWEEHSDSLPDPPPGISSMRLEFDFTSGTGITGWGAYIDDISVTGGAPVTISGYITVQDPNLTSWHKPMPYYHFSIAKLKGADTQVVASDVITNEYGFYSIQVPFTRSNLLYVFSTGQPRPLRPILEDSTAAPIVGKYNSGVDAQATRTISVDIQGPATFNATNTSFFAATLLERDMYTTDSLFGSFVGGMDSILVEMDSVNGFPASEWTNDPNPPRILINQQDVLPTRVGFHELGHQLNYQLHGHGRPTISGPASHYYYTVSNEGFAFDEGFAEFIEAASFLPQYCIDGHGSSFENNSWWQGPPDSAKKNQIGEIVEGAVAQMLFDLYDDNSHPEHRSPANDSDPVQNTGYMLPILMGCFTNYTDTANTGTFSAFAFRLVRTAGSRAPWSTDTTFRSLRRPICDVFQANSFSGLVGAGGNPDYCEASGATVSDEQQSAVHRVASDATIRKKGSHEIH